MDDLYVIMEVRDFINLGPRIELWSHIIMPFVSLWQFINIVDMMSMQNVPYIDIILHRI